MLMYECLVEIMVFIFGKLYKLFINPGYAFNLTVIESKVVYNEVCVIISEVMQKKN